MLGGIFIGSPISAGFVALGSLISTATCVALGVQPDSVYSGVWGFSGVLTSIVFGGIFIYMNKLAAFLYMILAVICTTLMHGATIAYL